MAGKRGAEHAKSGFLRRHHARRACCTQMLCSRRDRVPPAARTVWYRPHTCQRIGQVLGDNDSNSGEPCAIPGGLRGL